MKLAELGLLYLLVGLGCAAVGVFRSRSLQGAAQSALLVLFWPLMAPFLALSEPAGASAGPRDREGEDFVQALERAADSPLGSLLPDRSTALRLADQLGRARTRLAEITTLLREPGFSEEAALARHQELLGRGDTEAAATAMGRVRKIRYIRELGERYRRELDHIRELIAELRIQAEVVRLAGDVDGSGREMTRELLCRIEGMDRALEGDGWHMVTRF